MVWVKICGIRDLETALFAARAGADALGFVFAPGRRQVAPVQAKAIIRALPPGIVKIGVFVDAPLHEVQEIARFCGLDAVQLHGSESPRYCRLAGLPVIKAFRVGAGDLTGAVGSYDAAAILLDTYVPGRAGGTGKSFDWRLAGKLKLNYAGRIILAGGLNAQNVQEAIRIARPDGVDVSSGVETNGRKDREKIKEFIKKAKEG
ncbi:MAG: phosphoribosylanthranilate isomerase [Armatimonadetes bacterium]|nr:phosphoribosylanthranilate isomerase [Armatimonadota bacterium]